MSLPSSKVVEVVGKAAGEPAVAVAVAAVVVLTHVHRGSFLKIKRGLTRSPTLRTSITPRLCMTNSPPPRRPSIGNCVIPTRPLGLDLQKALRQAKVQPLWLSSLLLFPPLCQLFLSSWPRLTTVQPPTMWKPKTRANGGVTALVTLRTLP